MTSYVWFAIAGIFAVTSVISFTAGKKTEAVSDLLVLPLFVILGLEYPPIEFDAGTFMMGFAALLAAVGVFMHSRRFFEMLKKSDDS